MAVASNVYFWFSGVINNLKEEYLGESATIVKNIVGCESASLKRDVYWKIQSLKISWDCPFEDTTGLSETKSCLDSLSAYCIVQLTED